MKPLLKLLPFTRGLRGLILLVGCIPGLPSRLCLFALPEEAPQDLASGAKRIVKRSLGRRQ
jgi:hypothetical protein